MKNKALSLIENLCEIKLSHVYYQCGGQTDSHAQEISSDELAGARQKGKMRKIVYLLSRLPFLPLCDPAKELLFIINFYLCSLHSRRCMTGTVLSSTPSPVKAAALWNSKGKGIRRIWIVARSSWKGERKIASVPIWFSWHSHGY